MATVVVASAFIDHQLGFLAGSVCFLASECTSGFGIAVCGCCFVKTIIDKAVKKVKISIHVAKRSYVCEPIGASLIPQYGSVLGGGNVAYVLVYVVLWEAQILIEHQCYFGLLMKQLGCQSSVHFFSV